MMSEIIAGMVMIWLSGLMFGYAIAKGWLTYDR